MDDKNITKKQHYVPQVYLRGFSGDGKRVWSYLLDTKDSGKLVSIESVCRENFLYEVRDEENKLIVPNWIEKILSKLEGMFATNLRNLEKKTSIKENYQTKCFLNANEKAFWKLYVGVQMMRSPIVLKAAEDVASELWDDQLSANQKYAFAVSQCLPFFNELKPEDENAFAIFLKPLLNMSIVIGVDETGTLFTSDDPVYCYSSQRDNVRQIEEYEEIVMPLTSDLALLMLSGELSKEIGKNRLILLDNEGQDHVKFLTACAAHHRVFSKRELAAKDLEIIEQARKEKAVDETNQRG